MAFKYENDEYEVMVGGNRNYNPAGRDFIIWLFISVAIIVMLHILLPFPISFIVSLIVIFCLGIYRDDRALRKAGMAGIKGWYKSMFSSGFGSRTGLNSSAYQSLKFSCINCSNEHTEIACPNCGSKRVRPV